MWCVTMLPQKKLVRERIFHPLVDSSIARKRERILYSFSDSSDSHNGQSWASSSAGAWNSIQSLTRVAETQVLGAFSIAFPAFPGSCIRSRAARTPSGALIQNAGVESSGLTHVATTPALVTRLLIPFPNGLICFWCELQYMFLEEFLKVDVPL